MRYDILASEDPELLKRAKELGIEPLILGKDVLLVSTPQQVKNARALIVLSETANRAVLESAVDGAVNLELEETRKDAMNRRRAGLDQIDSRILAENKRALVLNFSAARNAEESAVTIGRMVQNARVAAKQDVPVLLFSFATTPEELTAPHDLEAFWRAMGVAENVVSKAAGATEAWVKRAQVRASPEYLGEGVTKTKGI